MTTGRTVRWIRISAERGEAAARVAEAVFTKSRLVIMGDILPQS